MFFMYTSGYRILESGSLQIKIVDIKDAGIYVCVAQNSAGTAMSQVKLEVQG
jgi:Immunoglobulin I-set domain